MSPPTKKQLNKGFYGFETDDAEFLKIDRDPWEASASGHGRNAKFSDDDGFKRGAGAYTYADGGGEVYNRLPSEQRVSDKLRDILDDVDGMGSGNAITGGGGPLSKSRGVGAGKPRFAPKTGPRTNGGY
jgi:hypothetical protein